MDSKQIELLLEKYWNCETSLEEEKWLRDYFHGADIPEPLKETAELFRFFEAEGKKSLNENFGDTVTKQIHQRHRGKIVKMFNLVQVARIAAGVLVLAVATFFIRQEVRKSYPPEIVDTYSDPKLAFEETKKALMMISKGFGKAKQEASKIRIFNEAERKIQGKDNEAEKKEEAKI